MLKNKNETTIFNEIVAELKIMEIDGESTQHLLEQIDMDDQMLRQLIMTKPLKTIMELIAERTELDNPNDALRSHVLMLAGKFLCADSDEELIEQIVAIAKHKKDFDMIDNVRYLLGDEYEYIRVWDKVVYSFTCNEFLEQIEYVDNLFDK